MRNNPDLNFNVSDEANNRKLEKELLKEKKVRLIEESLPYEDLAVLENFSEDEITYELKRKILKERKDKIALQKARVLEN